MNSLKKRLPDLSALVVAVFLVTTVAWASTVPAGHQVQSVQVAEVAVADLMPGLQMHYYLDFYKKSLAKLPKTDVWPGELGESVAKMDSSFGGAAIFSSGAKSDVGIRLNGYLYCDVEGTYFFQALSNDGVMLYIDNKLVLEDPVQHADRLTALSSVEITEPGYYPIEVEYFQSRGTAALKVYWKKPDRDGLVAIPESAYWHIK